VITRDDFSKLLQGSGSGWMGRDIAVQNAATSDFHSVRPCRVVLHHAQNQSVRASSSLSVPALVTCRKSFPGHTMQKLHGDEGLNAVFSNFVDRADIGMVKCLKQHEPRGEIVPKPTGLGLHRPAGLLGRQKAQARCPRLFLIRCTKTRKHIKQRPTLSATSLLSVCNASLSREAGSTGTWLTSQFLLWEIPAIGLDRNVSVIVVQFPNESRKARWFSKLSEVCASCSS
jgi:hypothetical protein